ncbi:MAG: YihY/virulence factor BrkB family protein [Xanthobacteraceae bacterium]
MSQSLRRALPNLLAAMAGMSIAYAAIRIEKWGRERRHPPGKAPLGGVRVADEPRVLQQQRALETGRGRHAEAPTRIPWRGWKDILWRTYAQISEDRLLLIAAGVVFYAMLAIVPAITALVSMYGLFTPARTISAQLNFLADVMPGGAYQLVSEQVVRIAGNSDGKLTLAFIVGLFIALWSANAGIKAIFDALNIVYDEDEKRGIIALNAISLTFTLGAICVLLLALGAVVVLPLLLAFLGIAAQEQAGLLPLLRWPALFVLLMAGLAVLYRFGPSRRHAKWRWLSVGSVFAALTWIAVSVAFSWYLSRFADYNATYGSLGAVIGLMMWMWISTTVVLVGAALNSEIEHQTARDSTVGPAKPLGARGAVMADTVGAAQG